MQMRFCLRLRPGVGRLGRCPPVTRTFARNFSENNRSSQELLSLHPVRILGPTLWSVAAICTIYFSCAAFDVYRDAQGYSKDRRPSLTFEQIQADRAGKRARGPASGPSNNINGPFIIASPLDLWYDLSESEKVMASVAGINALTLGITYVPSTVAQNFYLGLAHTPAEGAFRYRQLLTCAFAHTGALHLGMNMFCMYNFAPKLANSPVFNGSGSHTLAFYLSAGVFSSLGSHIATNFWPNKMDRFRPSMGFSGVACAVVAAAFMEYPDARVYLYLLPWVDFSSRELLLMGAAFETLGALGLLKFASLNIGHTCHLSGMLFGAAYVTYAGGERCWNPSRRAAFRGLRAIGAI